MRGNAFYGYPDLPFGEPLTDRELIKAYLKALADMRHGGRKLAVEVYGDRLKARGYSLSPSDLKARL